MHSRCKEEKGNLRGGKNVFIFLLGRIQSDALTIFIVSSAARAVMSCRNLHPHLGRLADRLYIRWEGNAGLATAVAYSYLVCIVQ